MRMGVLMQTCPSPIPPTSRGSKRRFRAFGRAKLDALLEREHDSFATRDHCRILETLIRHSS